MDLFQGIILGIIQGLTEFLPVSSSGHLVLGQKLFGLTEPALFFDVSVHMGTLFAVVLVFFSDIRQIVTAFFRVWFVADGRTTVFQRIKADESARTAWLIILGSVPTAVIGLYLKQYERFLFSSLPMVGAMLLLTGVLLWGSRYVGRRNPEDDSVNLRQALCIGLVQGLAVIPGISRSGSTIVAGMAVGVERTRAARFSFLLSIPAIVGAQIVSVRDALETGLIIDPATIWGTAAAFVSGWGALLVLLTVVKRGRFYLFAPYCWIIGVIAVFSAVI